MGRHVATTTDNNDAHYWFKATVAENQAWKEGRAGWTNRGRHIAPSTCGAYVLVAGGMNPCTVPLAEHEGKKHSHSIYGTWDNVVYDLDKYRKRFVK